MDDVTGTKHLPLKFEVPRGLIARLKLTHLLGRFPQRLVWAGFMFVNGFATIAILAAVAMVSGVPFVFPSIGPTAFLLFFTPTAPIASPRNTIIGHAIRRLCVLARPCAIRHSCFTRRPLNIPIAAQVFNWSAACLPFAWLR